jgi:transposase-like protein
MRRIELYAAIQNTADAIAWCRQRGLLIANFTCAVCDQPMKEEEDNCSDGRIWRCRRIHGGRRHQKSLSIRHRSFMSHSRLSIKDTIYLLYEWAAKSSVEQVSHELAISDRTISEFYRLYRNQCSWAVSTKLPLQIGGEGSIVEIDECQIGRRKAHRGRIPREIWILGGIVRDSNPIRCFIEVVHSRNEETLLEVIRRRIHTQSRICSDGWAAYGNLSTFGFAHSVVNHSTNFVSPGDRSTHTQNIENLWCCLRRFLRSKGTYTRRHLIGYLDEFIFRKSFVDSFEMSVSLLEERCLNST